MAFLTRSFPVVIEPVKGAATIHSPSMVYGNAAVNGTRYQLILVTLSSGELSKCTVFSMEIKGYVVMGRYRCRRYVCLIWKPKIRRGS